MFGSIGWLFADLMVALALTFLVATTVGQPRPAKTPHPPHTPTPTPMPTPPVGMDNRPTVLHLNINGNGLLQDSSSARNNLATQVRDQLTAQHLAGRRSGLVLAFGGSLDQGIPIAKKANAVLDQLGKRGLVFADSAFVSYRKDGASTSDLELDIFFYKQ